MEDIENMEEERRVLNDSDIGRVESEVGRIIDYQGIIREARYNMYDQESKQAISQTAELSRSSGELVSAGSLLEIAPDANFVGEISLKKKLEAGEITSEDLAKAKEILAECYVKTGKGSPMRCGDGRGEEVAEEMTVVEIVSRQLGPQAMGASQTHALANRMSSEAQHDATLESDLLESRESIVRTGSELGLHTDRHEHVEGKTGCGAVNGIESGVDLYNTTDDNGATQLAKAIVGELYDEEAHSSHRIKATQVPAAYASDRVKVTEKMVEISPTSKQVYVKSHEEVFAVVNNVYGTTLNRELFIHRCMKELGKVVQVFNIDAWHLSEVALERFPDDAKKQAEYITAAADWQARPALNLTDGTLEVVVRVPNEKLALSA